jgi:two-component system response regulator WspF
MKIGIVNDVSMICTLLTNAIQDNTDHEVIWVAEDGQRAIDKAGENTPDLILMDLIMPGINGIDATREIMASTPCAIVIVTASLDENADMVFSAMGHGALDAIATPNLAQDLNNEGISLLLRKLHLIQALIKTPESDSSHAKVPSSQSLREGKHQPLIAIGSSTGGPKALATLLSALPDYIPASIVIVQHVDENFTAGLADWLDSQSNLDVCVAKAGAPIEINKVYLAGGDKHLLLDNRLCFEYTDEPVDYAYRPSIDEFFNSINQRWPGPAIGVLLTGMGNDGAKGLLTLKNNSGLTIAQDEESCAVYGMPKAAVKINAAHMVLPINDIPVAIMKVLSQSLRQPVSHAHR